MIKDTFRTGSATPDRSGIPTQGPFWVEESDGAFTELHLTDQADSVSIEMRAETMGMHVPDIQVSADVRITYRDLEKLRDHASAILARHEKELAAERARAHENTPRGQSEEH